MTNKPKVNSQGQQEIDKAEQQFESFNDNVQQLTMDRMNAAPKADVEAQTKISAKDMEKSKDIYLKPKRSLPPGVHPKTGEREKFNEKFRDNYNFAKEYVQFIAENKEIIGETIDLWTKPFPGMNCEEWAVPVNKPVWGPRYLAEQIQRKSYHRLTMQQQNITSADGIGNYFGQMAVDTTIPRLEARPVSTRKSIFMGANF